VKIGVVREIKVHESRVALTPAGAERLVAAGHEVMIETQAGVGSGLDNATYEEAGARIGKSAAEVWGACDMILKVKEPLPAEWPLMRKGQTLFTYLHLAADRALTEAMVKTGSQCFAYETLEVGNTLPLLTPMSEVAGRMAIQAGAQWLERSRGGSGISTRHAVNRACVEHGKPLISGAAIRFDAQLMVFDLRERSANGVENTKWQFLGITSSR
jgi:alanine dehydrogenase